MLERQQHYFRPRARLLKQLGDQLIKDEGIALFELVKNAYDADATKIDISLNYIENKELGEIKIKDNGSGMNYSLITNHWLEPGTDYKEKKIKTLEKSPLYSRLPLGEKGIGRFGSHKLGQLIEIVTKTDFDDEVIIKIDWTTFDKAKYLEDTPIDISINNTNKKSFPNSINAIPKKEYESIISKMENSDDKDFIDSLYIKFNEIMILKKNFVYDGTEKKLDNKYVRLKKILNNCEYFTTGTRIKINKLWNEWSRGMLRNTFRSVNSINSPFPNNKGDFKINLTTTKKDWLDSLMTPEKAINYALFVAKGYIEADTIYMEYQFKPWEKMKKLKERIQKRTDFLEVKEEKYSEIKKKNVKELVPFTLEDYNIGRVDFEYYMYDRDTKTLAMLDIDKAGLKKLLDNSGGVRVYRDNIRVYDYGEPGTDWLKMDYQRFQTPGQAVSNNQILGAVYLHRNKSSDLVEKTNREGFVVNPAFETFIKAISLSVKKAAQERNHDKENIRDHYGVSAKSEPVINKVESLKLYVTVNVKDEQIRNKINEKLVEIEKEYKDINEKILTAAGSGLALNVAIHEMEKIIDEMINIAKEEKIDAELNKHIDNLYSTLKQYAQLAHYTVNKNLSLKNTIKNSIDLNLYRLFAHNIEVENNAESLNDDIKIDFPEKLLLSSISNIFDNSIYWLEKKFKKEERAKRNFKKKIYIKLTNEIEGGPTIIIADNGEGFQSVGTEQLTKAFVGYKDSGMGLGLYIINETMSLNKGKLLFPEKGDIDIPKDIDGAVIALQFLQMETK